MWTYLFSNFWEYVATVCRPSFTLFYCTVQSRICGAGYLLWMPHHNRILRFPNFEMAHKKTGQYRICTCSVRSSRILVDHDNIIARSYPPTSHDTIDCLSKKATLCFKRKNSAIQQHGISEGRREAKMDGR